MPLVWPEPTSLCASAADAIGNDGPSATVSRRPARAASSSVMTTRVAAQRLEWSEAKMWRIEPGKTPRLYTRADGWRHLSIYGMGIAEGGGGAEAGGADLYAQAVQVVTRDRKASTSYIQRRLQIGYNRAASLMERMEKEGIVGQANHAGKREILIPEEEERF